MASKRRSNGQGTLFHRVEGGPWVASWFDHTGKRRKKSTRTTDRRAAERMLAKYVADAALRRDGVVDPRHDQFSEANRIPLADHFAAYCTHCRQSGQAEKHVVEKVRHLKNLLEGTGATRLSELTSEAVTKHMWAMKQDGKAARTANFTRQVAVAFMNWCKNTNRVEVNPLTIVSRQDERNDRRRVRRPLSEEELTALFSVAEERGRRAWYMAAALAGLRKGDLIRLKWADLDFDAGTITIRDGKAKREDIIPMHPQLAEELSRRLEKHPALPQAKVFPTVVTDVTRQKDFLRAGIARRETVFDADGQPVMVGKGKRQRVKTRIVTEDAEGRVIDLHAMRTTLGTNLAKAGVAPQIAQRIMRHSDYRTTLKHYTVLGLVDTAKAMNAVPSIATTQADALVATGTAGLCEDPQTIDRHTVTKTSDTVTDYKGRIQKNLQLRSDDSDGSDGLAPLQEEDDTTIPPHVSEPVTPASSQKPDSSGSYIGSSCGTKPCDSLRQIAMDDECQGGWNGHDDVRKSRSFTTFCDDLRDIASICSKAGDEIRTHDIQLGRLTL